MARFSLAKACAARRKMEESRFWLGEAVATLGHLSAEEREHLLSSAGLGMKPARFARKYGWKGEAEIWQTAFDAWEQAQCARMREEMEELDALDPLEPSQWEPPSGGVHDFLKEQGLGFDFSLLHDLMGDLAETAGLDEEAEAWRDDPEER